MKFLAEVSGFGLSNGSFGVLLFLFLCGFAVMAWWHIHLNMEFDEALEMFKLTPSDKSSEKRLIDAARYRAYGGKGSVHVARLIQEVLEIRSSEIEKKGKFVAELEALAELSSRGQLTEAEFEQAKAKLLNS